MRTHYCGQVNSSNVDQEVTLSGWVMRRRDHGGVIFLDVYDSTGLCQVVFQPEEVEAFSLADKAKAESSLTITGLVRLRPDGTINKNLATGEIECVVQKIILHNIAQPLPFVIHDQKNISEEVRLKYRFLDLRSQKMQHNLILRSQVILVIRRSLEAQKFLEVETPILTKSTPEGARDYLVPSRNHPGQFFALPQSPQIFKQLLMMSTVDKYYQVVKCFRDEDLRADRQPEFTQLDLEMAFVDENIIKNRIEDMLRAIFKQVLSVDLPKKFTSMSYLDSMMKYGNDRPDLRNPLVLVDINDLCADVDFIAFSQPAKLPNHRVTVLNVPGGITQISRKGIDEYTKLVGVYGAKGLAYIKINDLQQGIKGLQSPILKFLPEDVVLKIISRAKASDGDLLFFGAGSAKIVSSSLSALRDKLGEDLQLIDQAAWSPVWIDEFPMFEASYDDKGKVIDLSPQHHPFTAPKVNDLTAFDNPENVLSRAYDIVLNGHEIGGGSIRIHELDMQLKVLQILGIGLAEAEANFGHLLEGLRYGAPPHGGLALGIDRLIMLMVKADSIRDVIAFPKTQTSACLLTKAPSKVKSAQLQDLSVAVTVEEERPLQA